MLYNARKERPCEKYSDNEYKENCSDSDTQCKKNVESDHKPRRKRCDSDSDEKCPCDFKNDYDMVYKYYKYLLETDENLMVRGSPAFTSATNTLADIIPQNYPVVLENVQL